jgi:hypothetical protein
MENTMKKQERQQSKPSSPSGWANLLASCLTSIPDEIPPGWKTIRQLIDESGSCETVIRRKLAVLLANGKVERKVFRTPCDGESVRHVPHWRII